MRVTFQFIITLVLALLIVWGIRTYAFTVYSVPVGGLPPELVAGCRVIVNRLDCGNFERGEVVVFADSSACAAASSTSFSKGASSRGASSFFSFLSSSSIYYIGRIEKLPGDTITLDTVRYVIPLECCKRCGCKDCRYYLVRTSGGRTLVHKHQMIGKAYKLF